MIDGMFQAGTDTAMQDQLARPARPKPVEPPVFGTDLFTAPFRGIGGGTAKSMAFGAEITGAFGQVLGATGTDSAGGMFATQSPPERQQSERARSVVLKSGPEMSNPVGDALRQRAKDILPDPQTASTSAQVVSGLADFATRAVGYSLTLGPLAPAAMGGDAALEEADRLKQQGVDKATRTKAGAVAGAINAGSVVVPMGGATAAGRFIAGTAVGEGAMVGQAVAEKAILKAAGYDKLAESFDPLDPVSLALGVVPGALGAKFGGKPRHVRTEAEMRVAAELTPAEQARSMAYETSPANLEAMRKAIDAEKRPEAKAALQEAYDKLQAAAGHEGVARAVQAEPDLVPAARVSQVVDAVDAARLTPEADLAGRDAHVSAVELAHDQMARGEDVQVARLVDPLDPPQEDGTVRLFAAGEAGDKPLRLSTDLGAVETEARKAGAGVHFMDLPADNPAIARDAAGLHASAELAPGLGSLLQPLRSDVPKRAAAAAEQLRAARQAAETPPAPRATKAATADTKPAKGETATGSSGTKRPGEAPAGPQGASAAGGEGQAPGTLARAAAEAAQIDPEMLVHLEGMDAPMKVGELLARVQEEAAQDVKNGRLLEVAAACDLRG